MTERGRARSAFFAASLMLAMALVAAGPTVMAQSGNTEPSQSIEERLEKLEQQLEALKQAVNAAGASASGQASDRDLRELERRIELLSREIEKLTIGEAAVEANEPAHGFGPAASKVYRRGSGVSIGGYGELLYQGFDSSRDDGSGSGEADRLDLLRVVLYAGYRFHDKFLFNSEVEYEHANTEDNGEVEVEFAYVDYLARKGLNVRAGLLLIPMGFINEQHEPPTFLGSRRPDVERSLIPATWRENGLGLFGDLGPVSYRAYLVTGFDGAGLEHDGFSSAGIRGGRQGGSEAFAEDLALVGRVDWRVMAGLDVGGAFYTGDSGQGATAPTSGRSIKATTQIGEAHLQWRWRGVQARALWVDIDQDDADLINDFKGLSGNDSVGSEMSGGYVEVGYNALSQSGETEQALTPFVRYESFDTQDDVPVGFSANPANDVEVTTIGVSYKPIANIALKLDFQNFDNEAGTGVDQWNVGVGWLF